MLPGFRPLAENPVEAQHWIELRIGRNAIHPQEEFVGIERIVGHHNHVHAGHLTDFANVRFGALSSEKFTGLDQIGAFGRKIERLEDGDYSAGSFGDGGVFDEERAPDCIGAILLSHGPIVLGRHLGRAEEFGFQVVVGEEVVDAPQSQLAKCRGKQVRVHVDDRGRG